LCKPAQARERRREEGGGRKEEKLDLGLTSSQVAATSLSGGGRGGGRGGEGKEKKIPIGIRIQSEISESRTAHRKERGGKEEKGGKEGGRTNPECHASTNQLYTGARKEKEKKRKGIHCFTFSAAFKTNGKEKKGGGGKERGRKKERRSANQPPEREIKKKEEEKETFTSSTSKSTARIKHGR